MLGGFPSGMYVDYAVSTGKTTVPGASLFYPALVYLKSCFLYKMLLLCASIFSHF